MVEKGQRTRSRWGSFRTWRRQSCEEKARAPGPPVRQTSSHGQEGWDRLRWRSGPLTVLKI